MEFLYPNSLRGLARSFASPRNEKPLGIEFSAGNNPKLFLAQLDE